MDTRKADYTRHLLRQEIWWKKLLDVQMPYRLHLKYLNLGYTLDLGCGVGRNLVNLGKEGQGVGVDHNDLSIAIAKSRGLTAFTPEEFFISTYAKSLTFDSLLISHVAEHMHREDVVNLLKEYLDYIKPTGKVVCITPQEAGFKSDTSHVEFMSFRVVSEIYRSAGLKLLQQYSFPFHRVFGGIFKYNEFITIGEK